MKKVLLFVCALALTFTSHAQLETPQPSPLSKIEQKVGLTDISVEYSRPGVKGRKIFGDLVPYGKVWRAGANKNTTVTFSDDVTVGGKTLKAGTYAVYVKPSEKSWEIMFYTDSENWGTPRNWDDAKVAATVKAEVYPMPVNIETFTVIMDDVTNNSVVLGMMWEKAYAGVTIKVPTDKKVMAGIETVMKGSPTADDYQAAANYYYESGKDAKQAMKWIDKAVEMNKEKPKFWVIHQQALIHAKAGDKKGAIAAAKSSLKLAKEAKYDAYIKKNEVVLKEWGAM